MSRWSFAFTILLGSFFVNISSACLGILCKAPGSANGPYVIHSRFWIAILSSSLSSSSSFESDNSTSEYFCSSLPPPPPFCSPPLPLPKPDPKSKLLTYSPSRKKGGSSWFSTTSRSSSRVAWITSSIDETIIPMGVVFCFLCKEGRVCTHGISPTDLENWWVMGETTWMWWYKISYSGLGDEE